MNLKTCFKPTLAAGVASRCLLTSFFSSSIINCLSGSKPWPGLFLPLTLLIGDMICLCKYPCLILRRFSPKLGEGTSSLLSEGVTLKKNSLSTSRQWFCWDLRSLFNFLLSSSWINLNYWRSDCEYDGFRCLLGHCFRGCSFCPNEKKCCGSLSCCAYIRTINQNFLSL